MPDPVIDPATGEPVVTDPPAGEPKVSVEEFHELKGKLDAFEKMGGMLQPSPAAPAAPTGPTYKDEVNELGTQITALGAQIDEAVKEGNPVSDLLRQREELSERSLRLKIKHEEINPALGAGIQTIDDLSNRVVRGDMAYLDVVKDDYEATLRQMAPETRMSPESKKIAYDLAVGKNIGRINELEKEKILREASADPALSGGGPTGRSGAPVDNGVPKPSEVLSKDSLQALKHKGINADQHYRSMGYDGWADFWEKEGKEYFGDPNEEE